MQYFDSNIVEGGAESWVETEMSWVEVDGAGWKWVHGLVIPDLNRATELLCWVKGIIRAVMSFEQEYTVPLQGKT